MTSVRTNCRKNAATQQQQKVQCNEPSSSFYTLLLPTTNYVRHTHKLRVLPLLTCGHQLNTNAHTHFPFFFFSRKKMFFFLLFLLRFSYFFPLGSLHSCCIHTHMSVIYWCNFTRISTPFAIVNCIRVLRVYIRYGELERRGTTVLSVSVIHSIHSSTPIIEDIVDDECCLLSYHIPRYGFAMRRRCLIHYVLLLTASWRIPQCAHT